ncbi:MAG: hypothetical protein V2A34_11195, partial [Lentisphaerota bacterium]
MSCCNRFYVRQAAGITIAFAVVLLASLTSAQVSIPLHLGASQPVLDEFGCKLQGAATTGALFSDRIEVLIATNGVIYPPNADGSPAAGNQVICESFVGNLVAPSLVDSGLFSISMFNRPRSGSKLFIRAFNAPTAGGASFYGDSPLFLLDGNQG